jgi:hypothetical protein
MKSFLFIILLLFSNLALSNNFNKDYLNDTIIFAKCGPPSGHAYFNSVDVWVEDAITNMDLYIIYSENWPTRVDIFLGSANQGFTSLIQDGGSIGTFYMGKNEHRIIHTNKARDVIEIYSFWLSPKNEYKYSIIQSKGGKSVHKSSVLVGDCVFIVFPEP